MAAGHVSENDLLSDVETTSQTSHNRRQQRNEPIDRFHSRDQRPYWFNETKESF